MILKVLFQPLKSRHRSANPFEQGRINIAQWKPKMNHGPQFATPFINLKYIFVSVVIILTLGTLGHATPLVQEKRVFAFDKISPTGKVAIEKFRQDYREFLTRELSTYTPAVQADITKVFGECLDNSYADNLLGSNKLLKDLNKKYPNEPVILWHLAVNYFIVARRLPEDQLDKQIELLKMGFEKSKQCLSVTKTNPDCWLTYAASHGALAIAEGIFDTISEISDVQDEMHKAYNMLKKESDRCPMAPWKVDSKQVALGALAEYYRLAPDWWLFKLLSGVRGDKEKSWHYAKQMKVFDVSSANIAARSAMCLGADSDNQPLIDRGIALMVKGMSFELLHPFDEAEYRRLARLYNAVAKLNNPEPEDYYDLACIEFGNDDKNALKKKSAQ
jgi:hypothetical protein